MDPKRAFGPCERLGMNQRSNLKLLVDVSKIVFQLNMYVKIITSCLNSTILTAFVQEHLQFGFALAVIGRNNVCRNYEFL